MERHVNKATINQMLENSIGQYGSKSALSSKIDGVYQDISYAELGHRVKCLCLGLIDIGIHKGDRVALLSENRPEWAITDLAILAAGGVNVPMFPSLTSAQIEYIVRDSKAKVICVSSEKQLGKIKAFIDNVPHLKHVIMLDPIEVKADDQILTYDRVCDRGREVENGDRVYQESREAVKPGDLATTIYTSGTTGEPKGVMLTHSNFVSNAEPCVEILGVSHEDVFLSFLPLCHVFERLAGYYIALSCGATIAYAESPFTVAQNMAEVRPTIMAAVPRLYEMMHDRVIRSVQSGSLLKKRIFHWSIGIGRRVSQSIQQKRKLSPILRFQASIAQVLLFKKLQKAVGGRLRFFVSGGAPLPRSTAEFFHSVGILILEGYGLTETSPVISVNRPDYWKFGTVGPPIPGVEVRIADDGEILSRGPHIMQGYLNDPQATADAISSDGWFHTGDMGGIDEEGFLRVTDRKKNIIVLSNGKNVAPQPIESQLKRSPYISQVMLVGNERKCVTALITPDFDVLREYAKEKQLGVEGATALINTREVIQLIRSEITRLLADFADYERVRMFTLMDREFTQEADEVTPTLKLKRRVILEKYRDKIAEMYGEKK